MGQWNNSNASFNEGTGQMTFGTKDAVSENGVVVPQLLHTGASVSASDASRAVFIANDNYQIVGVSEAHTTASASGTLQVEVLTGTQAPGSGTNQLTGTMSLSGTANTVNNGTLVGSPATIAAGSRIGIVLGGTLTSLAGCQVTIWLKRV